MAGPGETLGSPWPPLAIRPWSSGGGEVVGGEVVGGVNRGEAPE
jgi:hypothetical protein